MNRIQSRERQAKKGIDLLSQEKLTIREMQFVVALSNRLAKEQNAYKEHFGSSLNMDLFFNMNLRHINN